MRAITEILNELKRPFPPDRVSYKVQSTKQDQTAALIVAYVDARDVIERLNTVCPEQWSDKHSIIVVNNELLGVECSITIRDSDTSLTRMDVGIGDSLDDANIGVKTHYSDAFKRAGVKFNIAISLYDLPQIWLNEDKLYKPGNKIKGVSKDGIKELRERYAKWVVNDYVKDTYGDVFQ
jgi:hypothetical protein